MQEDNFINAQSRFDSANQEIVFCISAKKNVRLVELQGNKADLEAFGCEMPSEFRVMRFGEGVEIPDGMKDDVEFLNKSQFRWGLDRPIKSGELFYIKLKAVGKGKDRALFTLAYTYPKVFGLLMGKNAIYLKLGAAD